MDQDGYPRTLGQADAILKLQKIDRVINFHLPISVLVGCFCCLGHLFALPPTPLAPRGVSRSLWW
jgi:hypothetical protein